MVSAAFAGGGAGAGLGTQRALQAQKPERGVWGKGGLWGVVEGGRRLLFPSFLPKQGWAQGPKPGLCCPLVSELIPRAQLLPLPSTWMGKCVQGRTQPGRRG